jgi:hypothetical protein
MSGICGLRKTRHASAPICCRVCCHTPHQSAPNRQQPARAPHAGGAPSQAQTATSDTRNGTPEGPLTAVTRVRIPYALPPSLRACVQVSHRLAGPVPTSAAGSLRPFCDHTARHQAIRRRTPSMVRVKSGGRAQTEMREGERRWLARKDSNLQSPDPESGALPIRPLASDARGAARVYRETAPSSTVARPTCAVRPCRAVPAPAVSPRCP